MASSLYRLGTINVTNNSKIVSGNGTGWLATDIRPGDILRVEGHSLLYFLDIRNDQDEIVLDTEYTGTTAAAVPYTIVRMSGDWGSSRVLALQVAEYIRNFNADALTQEALDAALADIDAALIDMDAKVAVAEAAKVAAELAETNAETAASTTAGHLADTIAAVADVEEFLALAQAAATAAEAGWDAFDDKYLGAKATNPTLDNDGNALVDGAIYFNTTDKEWRAYDLATTTWYANNSGGAVVDRYYLAVPGSGLTYTLPKEPSTENALDLIVGGVPQPKNGVAYTWLGTTLTLVEDPGDDLIEMIIFDALPLGVVPNNSVGVNQLKLAEAAAIRTALGINAGLFREKITANRTYYVRTDGSDTHDGLTNTAGGAFLTIQKAIDTIAALDTAGFTVTIQVGDGTYTGAVTLKTVTGVGAAGQLLIKGNNAAPANVVVSVTNNDAFNADGVLSPWDILDLKVQTTTAGSCLTAQFGSIIRFGNVVFGACAGTHINSIQGGSIYALSNYTISGGAAVHISAAYFSYANINGKTVTLTGTPAFSFAFATGQNSSFLAAAGVTFVGAATGPRYYAAVDGIIFTNGAALTYFPGSAGGTVASGGQLDGLIGGIREVLTASRTYYVRTDGSDTNTGLANDATGAFLTIQKAIDVVATLDANGCAIVIQVGGGTRTTALTLKNVVGAVKASVTLRGDTSTPSNCLMNWTSVFAGISAQSCGPAWVVEGFKFQTTTSGYHIYATGAGTDVVLGANEYGACASGYSHIAARIQARVATSGSYAISGSATVHALTNEGGMVTLGSGTITLTGTPAFTSFVESAGLGGIDAGTITFSGSATGKKYNAITNGFINTFGAGSSYFPGGTPGTLATGGQYA